MRIFAEECLESCMNIHRFMDIVTSSVYLHQILYVVTVVSALAHQCVCVCVCERLVFFLIEHKDFELKLLSVLFSV